MSAEVRLYLDNEPASTGQLDLFRTVRVEQGIGMATEAELEMELVKRGIPYIVRGGIRFFEQSHIKDVLAYMKITVNPSDEIAWIRALTLCPGIGPGYAEKIYENFMKYLT